MKRAGVGTVDTTLPHEADERLGGFILRSGLCTRLVGEGSQGVGAHAVNNRVDLIVLKHRHGKRERLALRGTDKLGKRARRIVQHDDRCRRTLRIVGGRHHARELDDIASPTHTRGRSLLNTGGIDLLVEGSHAHELDVLAGNLSKEDSHDKDEHHENQRAANHLLDRHAHGIVERNGIQRVNRRALFLKALHLLVGQRVAVRAFSGLLGLSIIGL